MAIAIVTSLVIAGGILLFLWPEIPDSPKEWSYTGPLIGIVGVTLAAGEVILWRMSHPRRRAPLEPVSLGRPRLSSASPKQ